MVTIASGTLGRKSVHDRVHDTVNILARLRDGSTFTVRIGNDGAGVVFIFPKGNWRVYLERHAIVFALLSCALLIWVVCYRFKIKHEGPEEWGNMWQKSRAIWKYIDKHYKNDFDWFVLGGDDIFIIVENLRKVRSMFTLV